MTKLVRQTAMKRTTLSLFVLLFTLSLGAVEPIRVSYREWKDFLSGEFQGLRLSEEGRLSLSLNIVDLAQPEENLIFAAVADSKGDTYIGTGHNGKVYRLGKDKFEEVFKAAEPDIFALASDGAGNLYMASSPNGKIYKRDGSGKVSDFFNGDDRFIWDLEVKGQTLYAAAGGNGGKVYLINLKDGALMKTYEIDELNCVRLFLRGDKLWAGGSDKGTVYELTGERKESLYRSGEKEIKGIYVNDRNEIFVASAGLSMTKQAEKEKIVLTSQKASGEIVKLKSNGEVEKIWTSEDEIPYDLRGDGDEILWVTGDSGRIYHYASGKVSLIGQSRGKIALSLIPASNGWLGLCNFPAGIFRLEKGIRSQGEYFSRIHDTGSLSTFGTFSFRTEFHGKVSVAYRGGNTEEADGSWTPWSAYMTDPFTIGLSKKRYFQFKIRIDGGDPQSSVHGLEFVYLPVNVSPTVKNLKISFPAQPGAEPPANPADVVKEGTLRFGWEARDINQDKMVYEISLRREGETLWNVVERDWKSTTFSLEKAAMEEGEYQVRVVASDSHSNPETMALKGEMVSEPFRLDYTPPEIEGNLAVAGGSLSFKVTDRISPIRSVSYHTGDRKWKPLFPEDGICDSLSETFVIKGAAGKVWVIRAEDLSGNVRVRVGK